MRRVVDRTGHRYGEWLVVSRAENVGQQIYWNCVCSCGTERKVLAYSLKMGKSKSCGCASGRNIDAARADLTGKRFHHWTVISLHSRKRNGTLRWNVRCDCGNEDSKSFTELVYGRSRSCGCMTIRSGPRHAQWTGCACGAVSGDRMQSIRSSASGKSGGRAAVPYDIDAEYLCSIFTGKCALSGLDIHIGKHSRNNTASLDRIDSSQGYVRGNVQWLHKDINWMKNTLTEERFVDLCKQVAKHAEVRV